MGRIRAFFYNLDRAGAALWGAPDQATISSEAGESRARGGWWGTVLCWCLDKIERGHCERAREHAKKLEAADDGFVG